VKQKRPQRKTRKQKKAYKKQLILLIVSIVAIIGSFFYVMNHSYLTLDSVRLAGQKTLLEQDIVDEVYQVLDGYRFGIRRDNILFFKKNRLQNHLAETFPKIEDISVAVLEGDELVITIGERSAHSLWCIDREYDFELDEECYFADRNGLLYSRAPYFSGNVYTKVFFPVPDDVSGLIGSYVPVNNFETFFNFIDALRIHSDVYVAYVRLGDFEDVQVFIRRLGNKLYRDKPLPYIIYNTNDDYEIILRNVGVILEFDQFKKDFTVQPERLESIDVRFEDRIFYTFTPQEGEKESQEEL